jgi:hypothetical protein
MIIQSELHTNMLMYKIVPSRVPEIVYFQCHMQVIFVSVPEQKQDSDSVQFSGNFIVVWFTSTLNNAHAYLQIIH